MTCPTITNPSSAQTVCTDKKGINITVTTDQNAANSIKFVKFSTKQMSGASPAALEAAAIYAGVGISTVTPTGVTLSYTATYAWSIADFSVAGTYYIYAILNPDAGASCRPVQEIKIVMQDCCPKVICLPVTVIRN
jgi:hypothetical protein